MTTAIEDETKTADLGELALAIVFEDLRARVSKAELSEDEARALVEAALHRFPPDMHPELHALVDR
ncbi:hypothetical protein BH10PSE1_BH10PSE1_22790 [soil metagenome]